MGAKTSQDKSTEKAPGPGKMPLLYHVCSAFIHFNIWSTVYRTLQVCSFSIAILSFYALAFLMCLYLLSRLCCLFVLAYRLILGAYTTPVYIGGGPRVSMSGRHELKGLDSTPGPGAYQSPTMIGTQAIAYSMRPKTSVPQSSATVPGPGKHKHIQSYNNK